MVMDSLHVHSSAHMLSGLVMTLFEAVPTFRCHCLQPLLPQPAVPLHSRHVQRLLHPSHKHMMLLNTTQLRHDLCQSVHNTHGTDAKPAY